MTQIQQGTPEWHAMRSNRVTGSRCAKAFGEDQWTTGGKEAQWEALAREMYRQAHGLPQDPFPEWAMLAIEHGTNSAPLAAQKLKELGYVITSSPFVAHPKHEWLGMSPDGILLEGKKGTTSAVEIKCPVSKAVSNVREQKRGYWHQMQLGMECMDIDDMLFFQYYPETGEGHQEWVDRDPGWAKTYIPKAEKFMNWYKKAIKDPELIAKFSEAPGIVHKDVKDTNLTLELAEVVKQHQEFDTKLKKLKEKKRDLAMLLLKEHKGPFKTPTVQCHTTQAKGRISYARLVEEEKIPFETQQKYRSEGKARIYAKLTEE